MGTATLGAILETANMTPFSVASEESFSSMARRLGRMMDEMLGGPYVRFARAERWKPAVNLYETTSDLVLCVELAGMPREQIDVQAEFDRVVIRGGRADPQPPDQCLPQCVHMMEIDAGPFLREVRLPVPIEVDGVRATYRDGFLWVYMPKQAT
jgi:HSP20 family protein